MPWVLHTETSQLAFTSMIEFEVKDNSSVVSIPIENGSFSNYNKTDNPLEIKLTVAYEGTSTQYEAALSTIRSLKKSLELVALETPEAYYDSMNITEYAYLRNADTGPLIINITLEEIRQNENIATTMANNTSTVKNSDSVDTVSTGQSTTSDASLLWRILN